jgi:hypothetical protein
MSKEAEFTKYKVTLVAKSPFKEIGTSGFS